MFSFLLSLTFVFDFIMFRALDFGILNISSVCFNLLIFSLSLICEFEVTMSLMLLNCCSSACKKEGDGWKRVDVSSHSCMLRYKSLSLLCCHGFRKRAWNNID